MPVPDAASPVVNIVGERIALRPLCHGLIPRFHHWRNDFAIRRTLWALHHAVR